jgi:hypothetical protein
MKLSAIWAKPLLITFFIFSGLNLAAQQSATDTTPPAELSKKKKDKEGDDSTSKKIKLFKDVEPLQMSITADIRKMLAEKKDTVFQRAIIKINLPDSTLAVDTIEMRARGNFRRDFCYFPSVMLNFKKQNVKTRTSSLGKIKMVCTCKTGADYEQLVLKEYLCYRIFNLLSDKSFRVRLTKVNFIDSENKRKPFGYYGFLIEDVDDLAKRNNCKEYEVKNLHTELTDRSFMTLVSIFEYMIGNLDWSVPAGHNVKLILTRDSGFSKPFAIPYDFDYSGLVDAPYAVPPENLGTTSVTERLYRGFPREMTEIEPIIKLFNDKKSEIYALINGFEPLTKKEKTNMTRYLDEFYQTISNPRSVKSAFVDNAREN